MSIETIAIGKYGFIYPKKQRELGFLPMSAELAVRDYIEWKKKMGSL